MPGLKVKSNIKGGQKLRRFLAEARENRRGIASVDIGFFETAKYPDGTQVAAVAAWNEFGTKRIPERPFFRNAINAMQEPIIEVIKEGIDTRKMRIDRKLADKVGLVGVGEIQRSITTLREPPNAPSTIARKKSSNPLIDNRVMTRHVTHRVT